VHIVSTSASPVRQFSAYVADDDPKRWFAEDVHYQEHLAANRAAFPEALFALHQRQSFHDGHVRDMQMIFVSSRRDVVALVFSPRNGPRPTDGDPMVYILHFQGIHAEPLSPFPRRDQEIAYTDITTSGAHSSMIFQFVDGFVWSIAFDRFSFAVYDCTDASVSI
jgi:hypothetical protein